MEKTQTLFTDQIYIAEGNMRQHIDRDAIYELGEDIEKNGLINPITVRPKNGKFELVAGQRRLLAHQVKGIIKIQCIVKELTDDEALAIQTSENLAREEVNPVDEANHIGRLDVLYNHDYKQIAHICGRSVKWVKDRLAVSAMPEYMQNALASKKISLGVALELVQITDERIREMWTEMAVRDGVSVDQANYWVHGWRMNNLSSDTASDAPPDGYVPSPSEPVKFACEIDGEKYDARVMRSVMIAEENLPLFYAFVKNWREQPAD